MLAHSAPRHEPRERANGPATASRKRLIALDTAAPFAGELPKRDGLVHFVALPCHRPIFSDEMAPAARADHSGRIEAKQHIVCALMQGAGAGLRASARRSRAGHLTGAQFSDAARKAVGQAKRSLFRPDWKRVFDPEAVAESIRTITR